MMSGTLDSSGSDRNNRWSLFKVVSSDRNLFSDKVKINSIVIIILLYNIACWNVKSHTSQKHILVVFYLPQQIVMVYRITQEKEYLVRWKYHKHLEHMWFDFWELSVVVRIESLCFFSYSTKPQESPSQIHQEFKVHFILSLFLTRWSAVDGLVQVTGLTTFWSRTARRSCTLVLVAMCPCLAPTSVK